MIRNTLKRLYIILIFIFLYAPIATLIVLSFNASKTRAKWGGFTVKWYFELFQNEAIMQEKGIPYHTDGHNQYSHAECRYRNRYLLDAVIYQLWLSFWTWHDFIITYHLQYSLCDSLCYASYASDQYQHL